MATTVAMRVKAALSALETARKALNAVDEDNAAIEQTSALLATLREDLAEAERRLSETQEEIVRTGAALRDEQQRLAAAQGKSNEEIGQLEARLKELNATIKEREAKAANVLAGLKALHQRISGEQRSE